MRAEEIGEVCGTRIERPVLERTADEDNRWPVANTVVGDRRAVL